ncbi:GNAT family N-acetyltransferase [Aureimonas leprariae]|uniref:GNAT family N-acetyltransferase n=1 Tax=Plantimonas leprariae TaxID=2615207 RepID=A0A7V7PMA5_9HYPH|nr:GNAT family protein [Aureimonas leprariae]KAB0677987.1 GNAT family N-acetyltransferase [Aureimonas leprariae]
MTSDLSHWTPRAWPGDAPIEGRTVTVEPIRDDRRFGELFEAYRGSAEAMWRWLPYGPFADEAAFRRFAEATYLAGGILFHAVVPKATDRAAGVAALMRIDQSNGVIEIGHIALGPALQRTVATTEMQYLLMRRVFDELGYRRYEWKCNDRNEPSKRAAERLGFRFEGTFRQHMIVKGENRDTAWFAITDGDWPALRTAFEAWLVPENFHAEGRQKRPLEAFRRGAAA